MSLKKKQPSKKSNRIKAILVFALLLALLAYRKIQDFTLRSWGQCSTGIIVSEVRPDSRKKDSFYFEFVIEGKTYRGDAWVNDSSLVGSEILVTYLPIWPDINRSVPGYFDGDFDCK